MKARKGFTLIELLVVISIIAILAAILFPVFANARKKAQEANCESNLKQIGTAIKMYLPDWDETYPTNRLISGNPLIPGPLSPQVPITPPSTVAPGQAGYIAPDTYGVDWVEALYKYIEQVSQSNDSTSVWRCQVASNKLFPGGTAATCYTTYVFNYNLVENASSLVKGGSRLMMVREMDRLCPALLRPSTYSTGNSGVAPQDPFLTDSDATKSLLQRSGNGTNALMHGNGSVMLFADGHVNEFSTAYFGTANGSAGENLTNGGPLPASCWDPYTMQWFNYGPTSSVPTSMKETIAVTP